jgi:hypothetical protein
MMLKEMDLERIVKRMRIYDEMVRSYVQDNKEKVKNFITSRQKLINLDEDSPSDHSDHFSGQSMLKNSDDEFDDGMSNISAIIS